MNDLFNQALVVCKEKTDLHTLRSYLLGKSADKEITEISTAKEALAYIQKLTLAKVDIPDLIFLDTSCSFKDSRKILDLLDKYYPKTSRKSVFLINRHFTLTKIMDIVKFKCVKDILTTPILKYELPSDMGRVSSLA